jgi:hypothetical protein
MAKQTINIGASPNDGTGTPLRTAFDYTNQNFTELYTATGPSGNNIVVPGSATITGDLTVDTNVLKVDTSNNRVGIVNASPTEALDVTGNVKVSGNVTLTSGSGSLNSQFWYGIGASSMLSSGSASWPLLFGINGVEQMRLNSTGLGVGVVPAAGDGSGVFKAAGTGVGTANTRMGIDTREITSGNAAGIWIGAMNNENTGVIGSRTASGNIAFQTFNGASWGERMRIDYLGNLLVGTTSGTLFRIISSFLSSSGNGGIKLIDSQSNNTAVFANFSNGTGTLGSITNNNNAGVSYNINSDYRLKESVQPLTGGLARINALKPSIYKWKSNGSDGEGFLAHELAEVVPFAVTGEKDAVNEDGSIKPQGVDLSKVVPVLVAAIKELTARVQTLEAK